MDKLVKYSSEHESAEYICLNSCGEQFLGDRDHHEYHKNGRIDFSIKYIVKGKGYFEKNGDMCEFGEGSLLLYFPKSRQNYRFEKTDDTQMLWAHFSGKRCDLLKPLKSKNAVVVPISDTTEFEHIFKKMILQHYFKINTHVREAVTALCHGYLLALISMIAKDALTQPAKGDMVIGRGVDSVLGYMNAHFNEPIDIQQYADMCFVSRDRFLHLFKEKTGISPYKFQLLIRIERAKGLLVNTSMSASECGEAVGFRDASYFCRIFKKYTAETPTAYRKNYYRF